MVERKPNEHNPFRSYDGREQIKQNALANNLEIYSCCFDYVIDHSIINQNNDFLNEIEQFFIGCEELQIPVVVLPLLEQSDLNPQSYKKYVPYIQDIADNLMHKSADLCIESVLPAAKLVEFLRLVDRENVSCVYDSGNRIVDGTDLVSEILLLDKWIKHFHIKDKNQLGENVILGTGQVNFEDVFNALRKIDYQGHFNFETTRGKEAEKTMYYHYQFSKFFLEESYRSD